jgi:uncharacterized protein YoxC
MEISSNNPGIISSNQINSLKKHNSLARELLQKYNKADEKSKQYIDEFIKSNPDIARHSAKVLKNHPDWIDPVTSKKNQDKMKFILDNLQEHPEKADGILNAADKHPQATETLWKYEKKSRFIVNMMEKQSKLYEQAAKLYKNDSQKLKNFWEKIE